MYVKHTYIERKYRVLVEAGKEKPGLIPLVNLILVLDMQV